MEEVSLHPIIRKMGVGLEDCKVCRPLGFVEGESRAHERNRHTGGPD